MENKQLYKERRMTEADKDSKFDFIFKLIMIGDTHVGKSQLILRYIKNEFHEGYTSTLGVQFNVKTVVIDEKVIGVHLWDTAGQERYKALNKKYYQGAMGVILVYDITREKTFGRICNEWMEELNDFSDPDIVAILVGNKSDLDELRKVESEDAIEFAEKHSKCECKGRNGVYGD
eukprot:TRINITY_DN5961_c0_g2_i2.p1 TRINITY_DN5961_c0_g2~~TRINITY_DN5961_c0_g2_i2.p1  ORF type:complete len:175 (-),score=20.94 TRINITY_DN5961_c0_g2_i2:297-821(-)